MPDLFYGWSHTALWFSNHAVTPTLAFLHIQQYADDPVSIAEAGMIAALQIFIIAFILRPLETLAPAERWSDRRLTRADWQYTLLMLTGLFPLFSFLILSPLSHLFSAADAGNNVESIFNIKHMVPWFESHPWALFGVYYLVYDLVYYLMHRVQHLVPWWWAMHSMHHSQRQMSCWTNDRGSMLDGMLQSFVLASVGIAMGVDPDKFALLMLTGELVQNISHTNVRFGFGPVLEKILVDPKFHRLHHMLKDHERPHLHNCNYGQVFSIWDVLFGTALYNEPVHPTGVGDPMIDSDNALSLVGLQWVALRRFWGAFWHIDGWRLGDVSFGTDYKPVRSTVVPSRPPVTPSSVITDNNTGVSPD
jgi:sterol desaturase/sphingolipid hydroxylase (fatty acid hydroxylase superfamily)